MPPPRAVGRSAGLAIANGIIHRHRHRCRSLLRLAAAPLASAAALTTAAAAAAAAAPLPAAPLRDACTLQLPGKSTPVLRPQEPAASPPPPPAPAAVGMRSTGTSPRMAIVENHCTAELSIACNITFGATYPDDLPHVLRGHVLLGSLHETKLPLVAVPLGVQLLPLLGLWVWEGAAACTGEARRAKCWYGQSVAIAAASFAVARDPQSPNRSLSALNRPLSWTHSPFSLTCHPQQFSIFTRTLRVWPSPKAHVSRVACWSPAGGNVAHPASPTGPAKTAAPCLPRDMPGTIGVSRRCDCVKPRNPRRSLRLRAVDQARDSVQQSTFARHRKRVPLCAKAKQVHSFSIVVIVMLCRTPCSSAKTEILVAGAEPSLPG